MVINSEYLLNKAKSVMSDLLEGYAIGVIMRHRISDKEKRTLIANLHYTMAEFQTYMKILIDMYEGENTGEEIPKYVKFYNDNREILTIIRNFINENT